MLLALPEIIRDQDAVRTYAALHEERNNQLPSYFAALNKIQTYNIPFEPACEHPLVLFDIDEPLTCRLLDSLRRCPELDNTDTISAVPSENCPAFAAGLREGRALLHTYEADALEALDRLVASIIVVEADGYFGGSFWHSLGTIWMSPKAYWLRSDYAENLLHETVHQSMFLHDMVHSLFAASPKSLAKPNAEVHSSIRGTKRPFDHAFHAATVSVTLTSFYDNMGDYDRATQFARGAIPTIIELQEKSEYLTEAGGRIVHDMVETLQRTRVWSSISHDERLR